MNLRAIEKSDLEECTQLYSSVFSSEPWNEQWTPENSLERIVHLYESKGFEGVLAYDNAVLGFAIGNIEPFYYGKAFYLRDMCTSPAFQGRGIGKAVLNYLESRLVSKQVKNIYLTTERDIPAAKFYERDGFQYINNCGFYSKPLC